jgi:hypothetical protein
MNMENPRRIVTLNHHNYEQAYQDAQLLCAHIALRLWQVHQLKLPRNCPFVFYDILTKRYIHGDAYFDYNDATANLNDCYNNIMGFITAEELAIQVDVVIEVADEGIPFLSDEKTFDDLIKVKGSKNMGQKEDQFHRMLERPGGLISFYLPDSSVLYGDVTK